MPVYKFRYFEQALDSVLGQTYPALELIICDDSAGGQFAEMAEQKQALASFPIRYFKNEIRLGEHGSTAKGIQLARGKYIKFLHDDDVLQPDCVAELVAVMESDPSVAMASSRRQRIDAEGQLLPNILATCFPFSDNVLVDGPELVSFLAEYTINFIGEPSCVMARRADLLEIGGQLMSLNGCLIHWVGDLALYAKLLQRGNLAFLSKPLTSFRVSQDQFSQVGRDQLGIGDQGHADFRRSIRELGWFLAERDSRFVRVAPITHLKARVFKSVDVLAAIQRASGLGGVSLSDWLEARRPSNAQQVLIEQRLEALGGGPHIAILLVEREGEQAAVELTLASLETTNLYRNMVVRVVTSPTSAGVSDRSAEGEWVACLNRAIADLQADWILLVEAGVEFTASGLLIAALDLGDAPESCLAVYADEVMRQDDGELGLALRPDLNLDLLLSFPASMSRHWLFRCASLQAQGGFADGFGQAFELEYQLRLIEQQGLAGIGHISEPLLASDVLKMRDSADERAVIERHLRARGYEQPHLGARIPGCYQLDYGHVQQPLVSILIVVKGQLAQIQRCMDTLLENTAYPHYEVMLLDHGNDVVDVCNWLAAVEQMGSERIRVVRFGSEVSREALCNQAALQARGGLLLWLGAGGGILERDWLQQLLNHALRPEVGAVGCKLLSADGKIHHAGLLLGLDGPAGRAFEGLGHDEPGYMQRLHVEQNYSALSAECLMLRRELFIESGGFDESHLLSRWADVDLCLRLRQAGYLNVWTPRAQLLMDAPLLPDPTAEEEDAMYARWLPQLARDPAYNPGFGLNSGKSFLLADWQLAWRPLQGWKPVPTVLAHPADRFGCGHYRVMQPLKAQQDAGLIEGIVTAGLLPVTELERFDPDVVILQRQIGEQRLEAMRRMKAFSRAFKVYELDDYLPNLPLKNAHRQHMPKDILKSMRRGLACVDRFVVSTEALAEAFADMHGEIRVVENCLPTHWWLGLQAERRVSTRPRVGWAGGLGHAGDLELIADVVIELANEVDWVFFGICPEKIRPYVKEIHAGVAINSYPAKLASLNLDLALAPLEQNLFNECKSNLRLLEYGACGFPVISSDVRCYQGGLPVTRVKNRFRDWVDAIRMHLSDLDATAKAGDELRAQVLEGWMLEGSNLEDWHKAWLPGL
ncbi:O-antigen biosynthesis protein [Pseudomonas sp. 8AS]|nr:O-antigen biosynthesis protein [Pseudomonas sp. 8AS]